MPVISVNSASHAPALRKAIGALKAALVVSAAAILSRGQGDLTANRTAALGHLDDFTTALHGIGNDILQLGTTAAPAAEGEEHEIDSHLPTLLIKVVDKRSTAFRQALDDILANAERDGLDNMVAAIGELGAAMQDVVAMLTGSSKDEAQSFRYDQFFLEAMQDLSQRDWSAN